MAEVALNIESVSLPVMSGRWVEWMLCVVGFATACMATATAFYKPPSGIFDHHKRAYYVSAVLTVVVGIAEVCAAAIWLSGDGQQERQRLVRRCVLCASILPLVFIAGLGGVRMLMK